MTFFTLLGCSTASNTLVQSTSTYEVKTENLQPTIEISISATPTISETSTPILVTHNWQSGPVLISLSSWPPAERLDFLSPRNDEAWEFYLTIPDFILYANGLLLIQESNGFNNNRILMKQLTNLEICQLLSSIEKIGFFGYDPKTYNYERVPWEYKDIIEINAWETKRIELYGLRDWLSNSSKNSQSRPNIEPALTDIFYILKNYPTKDMSIYQPEKMVFWIGSVGSSSETKGYPIWPIESISLQKIYSWPPAPNVLEEADGVELLERLPAAVTYFQPFFSGEEGKFYDIYARPLLPFESPPEINSSYNPIPSDSLQQHYFDLTCQLNE